MITIENYNLFLAVTGRRTKRDVHFFSITFGKLIEDGHIMTMTAKTSSIKY